MKTLTTSYLGESIQLVQAPDGWYGWWLHREMGEFGDGWPYPTSEQALTAVIALIHRNGAIDALLQVIDDWAAKANLTQDEHSQMEASLLGFVLEW